MSLPILLLRPIDGARKTAARAVKIGLQPIIDPLFVIEPLDWSAPSASNFDFLMFTSTNAVKHAGGDLEEYRQLPVLAVGKATAIAAAEAGFDVKITGEGGVEELLEAMESRQSQHILRLVGEDHVEIDSAYQDIQTCTVYRSKALPLGEKAQACLATEAVVLCHSARAATILRAEMLKFDIALSDIRVVALSQAVASAAGDGWKSVSVAEIPTDDALLSKASTVCQA